MNKLRIIFSTLLIIFAFAAGLVSCGEKAEINELADYPEASQKAIRKLTELRDASEFIGKLKENPTLAKLDLIGDSGYFITLSVGFIKSERPDPEVQVSYSELVLDFIADMEACFEKIKELEELALKMQDEDNEAEIESYKEEYDRIKGECSLLAQSAAEKHIAADKMRADEIVRADREAQREGDTQRRVVDMVSED